MKESMDATFGMLADTLKFKRWERQVSLIDKAEKIITRKNLVDKMRPISPNLALPIFQYASLEENESLHDIWANLLVTALDPSCEIPRSAFIDIIRQLEPVDIKILNLLYRNYLIKFKDKVEKEKKSSEFGKDYYLRSKYGDNYDEKNVKKDDLKRWKEMVDESHDRTLTLNPPTFFALSGSDIIDQLNIKLEVYRISIDNLIRERLVSSFTKEETIPLEPQDWDDINYAEVSYDCGYDKVCITALGVNFVKACTVMD
jgi:hypothetical protein